MALRVVPTATAQRSISPGISSIRTVSPSLCWLKIICSMDYALLLLLLGLWTLPGPLPHFCHTCVWPGWALGVIRAGRWKGKSHCGQQPGGPAGMQNLLQQLWQQCWKQSLFLTGSEPGVRGLSPVELWVCSGLKGRIQAQQVQPGVPAALYGSARFAGDATQPGRAVPLLKGWDCHLCGEKGML